jgi:hypothetical protein
MAAKPRLTTLHSSHHQLRSRGLGARHKRPSNWIIGEIHQSGYVPMLEPAAAEVAADSANPP